MQVGRSGRGAVVCVHGWAHTCASSGPQFPRARPLAPIRLLVVPLSPN